jgi:sugar/nucleoside kinase (ribokinase family)
MQELLQTSWQISEPSARCSGGGKVNVLVCSSAKCDDCVGFVSCVDMIGNSAVL